jgi:dipeptidase D
MALQQLEPQDLWKYFEALNAVPRPSKKEERVIAFMLEFGRSLGLETIQDRIGNVIIKKPASVGMENRQAVILQAHLDMVHQKNATTVFDFDQQGIEMLIDGDWVKANGTTLGADNGIGVAAIMAVLASKTIDHPALEALFTIDEETGMTGAKEMDGNLFAGQILLNLDTEDDDELSIGCAGGIDTNTFYDYKEVSLASDLSTFEITISGLLGGHSGMDIDKGRGNANKWMARILFELQQTSDIQLISFDGGSLRNAIPREAVARFACKNPVQVQEKMAQLCHDLNEAYSGIEPAMNVQMKAISNALKGASTEESRRIVNVLASVHNGVFRMSPEITDLVEASSSLARVLIADGHFSTQSLQRSSVESTKREVSMAIRCAFELMGARVEQSGDYPGWKPNPEALILKLMKGLYEELYQESPQVKACHAGLECGILGKHLPGAEMISFGPNIRAAHSPDEKVQISSVQKFWRFYLETLKRIPSRS